MSVRAFALLLLCAVAGCDGSGDDPSDAADPGRDSGTPPERDAALPPGLDAAPPPGLDAGEGMLEMISLDVGPISAAPDEERTVCVRKRIPIDEPIWVRAVTTHINPGSHHMITYRSTETTEETDPYRCFPFTDLLDGGAAPLTLSQEPDRALVLPDGTGLPMEASQMIRLELHFINYVSDDPVDVGGRIDIYFTRDRGELQEVDYIFAGPLGLSIDRRSTGSAEWFYRPAATESDPWHIFALTSHTHQLAELTTIERAPNASAPGTEVHVSRSWAEPPLDMFEPPLTFTGSDGLRVRCEYVNPTDEDVGFGESFNEEMCFLVGMYYPSHGFRLFF